MRQIDEVAKSGVYGPMTPDPPVVPDSAPPTPPPHAAALYEPSGDPVRGRETLALLLLAGLADTLLYRAGGFGAYAAFLPAAAGLLLLGTPRPRAGVAAAVLWGLLACVSLKLLWLGSAGVVVAGFGLLVAFAVAAAGRVPDVFDVLTAAVQAVTAGPIRLPGHVRWIGRAAVLRNGQPPTWAAAVLLPMAAVLAFGTLFVFANPDVSQLLGDRLGRIVRRLGEWLAEFSPTTGEVLLWVAVSWLATGLLRPLVTNPLLGPEDREPTSKPDEPLFESPLFAAARNTLAALIALFVAYLVFEFGTLWFRKIPMGFYYAGYAHEGAAWLTVALALATALLSALFRGRLAADPRCSRLRRLAWVWAGLNLLLAVAVYHRLFLYIGFNGMTRMRVVGLLGITAVAAGFGLVVWKIARGRGFVWLIRRQMWTLALAILLYLLLPVDWLVQGYNVRRILAGDPDPSVQITEHEVDASGLLALFPLLHAKDEIIRDGVRALFAEQALRERNRRLRPVTVNTRERLRPSPPDNWSNWQIAERLLQRRLDRTQGLSPLMRDSEARAAAYARFKNYAWQWY